MLSDHREPSHPRDSQGPHDHTHQSRAEPSDTFWQPERYAHVAPKIQHKEGLHLLELYPLEGSECLLDVGSGNGTLTALIRTMLPDGFVIGLDSDPSMLEAARQAAPDVFFVLGDISECPPQWFREVKNLAHYCGGIDIIFSNATLHHIYSWEKFRAALGNIRNILSTLSASNGGQDPVCLASFAGKGNFEGLIACAESVRHRPEWQDLFSDWGGYPLLLPDEDRMRSELAAAGFDVDRGTIKLVREDLLIDAQGLKDFCVTSLRSYGRHLRSRLHAIAIQEWSARSSSDAEACSQQQFVDQFVDEQHTRFAHQVAELYEAQNPPNQQGQISFPCVNIHMRVSPLRDFSPAIDRDARVADFSDAKVDDLTDLQDRQLIRFLEAVNNLPEVQTYKARMFELLEIQPGMTVLDAGAGTGCNSRLISKLLQGDGLVLALDLSLPRLAYAHQSNLKDTPAVTLHGDLQNIPVANNSLDRVMCERVLLHTSNSEAITREIFRVLRPGGVVVFAEFDFEGLHFDSEDAELTRQICTARANEITNPRAGAELEALLRSVEFTDVLVEHTDLVHPYASSELLDLTDIAASAGQTGYPEAPHVARWLQEQKKRHDAGTFRASTPLYLVVARKADT